MNPDGHLVVEGKITELSAVHTTRSGHKRQTAVIELNSKKGCSIVATIYESDCETIVIGDIVKARLHPVAHRYGLEAMPRTFLNVRSLDILKEAPSTYID